MAYLDFITAVTIAEPEGIPPIYSELGEPVSNSLSQNPKQHRASGVKRLSGRFSRPSYESLPKFSSHNLSKSPGLLPVSDDEVNCGQSAVGDAHSQLLSQVTKWLDEGKARRLQQEPCRGQL